MAHPAPAGRGLPQLTGTVDRARQSSSRREPRRARAAGGAILIATGAVAVGFAIIAVALTSLLLAAGVAILRHRLFDFDVIISNALTYAALTALVAGLYGRLTMLLQRLLLLLAAQQSDATLQLQRLEYECELAQRPV